MQTLFSILILLQSLVVISHDFIDIPGWVYGSRVRATVGRGKFLAGTFATAIFPALAAAFAVVYWNRPKPSFVPTYWLIYCAITVASAIAMWYVPYLFGPSEEHTRLTPKCMRGPSTFCPAAARTPDPTSSISSSMSSFSPLWFSLVSSASDTTEPVCAKARLRMRPHRLIPAIALFASIFPLTGCLVVNNTSGSGWSIWPGSLVITAILALIYFLTRR